MSKKYREDNGADTVQPASPELAAAAIEVPMIKNVTLKDYIGHKAKLRVEGATTADVTLAGFDGDFMAVIDADGRTKFHGNQFVREVFPNQ